MTLALTALSLMSCGASGLPAGLENEVANLARQGFCQTAGTSCGAYKTVETRKATEGDQWCIRFTLERTENNTRAVGIDTWIVVQPCSPRASQLCQDMVGYLYRWRQPFLHGALRRVRGDALVRGPAGGGFQALMHLLHACAGCFLLGCS